ncbi:MAG TPA: hypothetical protein VGG49_08200 [Steroidobacteraceae bacterium]
MAVRGELRATMKKMGGESKMKVLVQAFAVVADSVDLSVLGK